MRDELLQYNNLIKEYKEYYFNVYSFLINKNWIEFEPCENINNELWFDWLISPNLQKIYETQEDIYVIDIIDNEESKLDVEVSNCKTIVPSTSFVCTTDKNLDIKDVINKYKEYRSNYNLNIKPWNILINKGWYTIEVEDIKAYKDDCEGIDYLNLYINPDLDKEFVEAFITEHNVYDLLKHWPDYIVNSNIWWDYEQ
jgi:hypothetical protein